MNSKATPRQSQKSFSRQNSAKSNSVRKKEGSSAASAVDKGKGKPRVLSLQQPKYLHSARSSKPNSRGPTPLSKNQYIDLDPSVIEIEESPRDDSDLVDEISHHLILVAQQKGIAINKKK